MKEKTALQSILGISIAGLLFSGYLSFNEVIVGICPLGGCGTLLGLPVCVYGFVMYLAILVVSILGLMKKKK